MMCLRCDGLMVCERFEDYEGLSSDYEFTGWRCLNCGAIVDPVIDAHRHTTPAVVIPTQTFMAVHGTLSSSADPTEGHLTAQKRGVCRATAHGGADVDQDPCMRLGNRSRKLDGRCDAAITYGVSC